MAVFNISIWIRIKKALDFFATYVDIAANPMFEKENLLQTDTVLPQIAYYASLAAAKMEDYPNVLKYAPYAKGGQGGREVCHGIHFYSIESSRRYY